MQKNNLGFIPIMGKLNARLIMTTDITELAQSLKAAAEKAIGANERLSVYKNDEIIDISQHEGEQIDIDIADINLFLGEANPANILTLVEALEKAQQRITQLESRTVKLPDLRQIVSGDRYVWSDGVYNYSQDVKVALTAAGIKVEVE
ncbi:ead/Ea22-like family protein [Klebsiella pneumoniae]|uniref:ead/Ea22-like family protein n=3 Tax=Klebsiella pneumoniae TaxID=573 RepID=UPI001D0E060B|nr:ead/Ea22-like family protein [Klebsiella pneumoniae]MCU4645750.1 ead/Ea22-like family protein [Klebsiella pneumoniae]MCU4695844.1 ead/Ea22-like family protein [Klebsiella pneumoniae]MCU4701060.1 ead/Ea22-like family protein [Klebsiella pneumoniae]MDU9092470.1 ead/Ea22-like family protein [Klebsiella pneumoniae]MDX7536127.1 ead/Ea22-like family protein [Klebsiella pneumoniae]